jgi:hypothetical protein
VTLLASTGIFLAEATTHNWFSGDTVVLVSGLSSISKCLGHGVFVNCNRWLAERNVTAVSKFPVTQQAPGYVLHEIGLSSYQVLRGLSVLNAIVITGFVATVVVWSYRRSGTALAVLAGLLLIPGMLLPYAGQSFGEPLAVAAFCLVALTALRRDKVSPYLAIAAVLATMSKETAAPFVLLFGISAIGLSGARLAVVRRSAITLATGIVVGIFLLAAMNEFRYGTLLNQAYLSEARSSLSMIPSNVFGMIVSPNAGITWFWPGVMLSLAVLAWIAARRITGGPGERRIRLSALLAVATFLLTIVSLAYWWDPFGWYAWGPRLLLPSCGPVIVLALAVIGRRRVDRRWFSVPALAALALVSGLILLPSEAVVFDSPTYTSQIVATWHDHPICAATVTTRTQAETNACYRVETWRTTSMPLVEAVRGEAHSPILWTLFGLSWASVWLWLFVSRREILKGVNGPPRRRERDLAEPLEDAESTLSDRTPSPRSRPERTLAPRFASTQPPG